VDQHSTGQYIGPKRGSLEPGDETLVISRGAVHDLKNHPQFLMAHLRVKASWMSGNFFKEFSRPTGPPQCRRLDIFSWVGDIKIFLRVSIFHLKAGLEPILAFLLIVLLSPLLVAGGACHLSDQRGSHSLSSRERSGYRGQRFPLYKFRTMSIDAESLVLNGQQGRSARDALGGLVTKTRLDELPQLLNVLRGELSFVGPRPSVQNFIES